MILIRYLELSPKKWAGLQEAEVLTHESALLLWFQAFTSPLTSFKCAAAWNTHLLKLKAVQLRAIPLDCDNCHCLLLWWEQQLPPDLIGTLARRKCKTCIFFFCHCDRADSRLWKWTCICKTWKGNSKLAGVSLWSDANCVRLFTVPVGLIVCLYTVFASEFVQGSMRIYIISAVILHSDLKSRMTFCL